MAVPPPNRILADFDLPKRVDVAIIGGGIAGISTALELVERGHQVAVFEKGIVAGEQSGRNWGWCRQMGRDPAEVPLSKISLDLWRGMNARVEGETGFHQSGIAYLCVTKEQKEAREQWLETQAIPNGLTTKMLNAAEAKALAPASTLDWVAGMITPDDGRAEPQLAVPAMAKAVQKLGGLIFENCAVRGVEKQAGRISAIVTERGAIETSTVLIAGGAWSRRFCHNMGIALPQLTVVNSVMRTAAFDGSIQCSVVGADLAVRKRFDGGYTVADDTFNTADIMPDSFRLLGEFASTAWQNRKSYRFRIGRRFLEEARLARRWKLDEISPFEQVRISDPDPDPVSKRNARDILQRVHPEFDGVEIVDDWAGIIDVTPDVVPVISPINGHDGLYLSTGYSGHGFGLGPGAGLLMAQLITGEPPCVDPAPFRYDRYRSTKN